MARYKLKIEYDGTGFYGFQIQKDPKFKTVQGELQKAVSRICNEKIKVHGAGRTDTGVHALGQVVHFETEKKFEPDKLLLALNGLTDDKIAVKEAEIAQDEDFHARYSAVARRYVYIINNSPVPSAFLCNRAYHFPQKLNVKLMKQGAAKLVGNHDFKMFVKNLKEQDSTIKTLDTAQIFTSWELKNRDAHIPGPVEKVIKTIGIGEELIFFYYASRSFLHSQVRLMTGNLIETGRGALTVNELDRMLDGDETVKSKAKNIPGHGLYLVEVDYE